MRILKALYEEKEERPGTASENLDLRLINFTFIVCERLFLSVEYTLNEPNRGLPPSNIEMRPIQFEHRGPCWLKGVAEVIM